MFWSKQARFSPSKNGIGRRNDVLATVWLFPALGPKKQVWRHLVRTFTKFSFCPVGVGMLIHLGQGGFSGVLLVMLVRALANLVSRCAKNGNNLRLFRETVSADLWRMPTIWYFLSRRGRRRMHFFKMSHKLQISRGEKRRTFLGKRENCNQEIDTRKIGRGSFSGSH